VCWRRDLSTEILTASSSSVIRRQRARRRAIAINFTATALYSGGALAEWATTGAYERHAQCASPWMKLILRSFEFTNQRPSGLSFHSSVFLSCVLLPCPFPSFLLTFFHPSVPLHVKINRLTPTLTQVRSMKYRTIPHDIITQSYTLLNYKPEIAITQ